MAAGHVWQRAGVEVARAAGFDYGKREGAHADPDENLMRFDSPLDRRR